jgi:hypothetical protein
VNLNRGFGRTVRGHFWDSRPVWGELESGDESPLDLIQAIRKRYADMLSVFDERGRRLFAAAEARAPRAEDAVEGAKKTTQYLALIGDLKNVFDSATRGDPTSPLLWISRSFASCSKRSAGFPRPQIRRSDSRQLGAFKRSSSHALRLTVDRMPK